MTYHFNMKEAIEVLERKIKELQDGRKVTRRILRRKRMKGFGYLLSRFKDWDKRDKEKIVVIRKAIKVLSNPSNIG